MDQYLRPIRIFGTYGSKKVHVQDNVVPNSTTIVTPTLIWLYTLPMSPRLHSSHSITITWCRLWRQLIITWLGRLKTFNYLPTICSQLRAITFWILPSVALQTTRWDTTPTWMTAWTLWHLFRWEPLTRPATTPWYAASTTPPSPSRGQMCTVHIQARLEEESASSLTMPTTILATTK